MIELELGDIGAVRGKGIGGWFSRKLIKPPSDRFHFLLIGRFIPWERGGEGDYEIFESIGKGIAVGRLYQHYLDIGEDVKFYRIADPEARKFGGMAVTELSRRGRAYYDYLLILKLVLSGVGLLLRLKFPPWSTEQFPYGRNSSLICTEAVHEAWRAVGYPIIPEGICPLPPEFRRAELRGIIEEVRDG